MQQEWRVGRDKRGKETSPRCGRPAFLPRQQLSQRAELARQGFLDSRFGARLNVETSPAFSLPYPQRWGGKKELPLDSPKSESKIREQGGSLRNVSGKPQFRAIRLISDQFFKMGFYVLSKLHISFHWHINLLS